MRLELGLDNSYCIQKIPNFTTTTTLTFGFSQTEHMT